MKIRQIRVKSALDSSNAFKDALRSIVATRADLWPQDASALYADTTLSSTSATRSTNDGDATNA